MREGSAARTFSLAPVALLGFPLGTWAVGMLIERELLSQRTERALEAARARLLFANEALTQRAALLDSVFLANVRIDAHGRVTHASDAFAALTGTRAAELVGKRFVELFPRSERAPLEDALLVATERGRQVIECLGSHGQGTQLPLEITIVRGKPGEGTRMVELHAFVQDQREQRETAERAHFGKTDALTGLPNRRALLERLEQAIVTLRRRMESMALVYMEVQDLDRVVQANGAATGDAVLSALATRLAHAVRPSDMLARLGPTEFVLVAPGVASEEQLAIITQRLHAEAVAPLFIAPSPALVSLRIGSAIERSPLTSPYELIERARLALRENEPRRESLPPGYQLPVTRPMSS